LLMELFSKKTVLQVKLSGDKQAHIVYEVHIIWCATYGRVQPQTRGRSK
jgi:hypothetical protein